ncbi:AraC family transcriptional regulator [Flammeovirga sp. SubArs3]|uniref:AraC family transcriptional regulator n=1 Tax=Flammeovirga sp. SubArs3 TaxID=2995316 RepID=UPI00248C2C20|nr:AraC family transcriptional regulator [Flammeovirga sp. SubArs3]
MKYARLYDQLRKWELSLSNSKNNFYEEFNEANATGTLEAINCDEDLDVIKLDLELNKDIVLISKKMPENQKYIQITVGTPVAVFVENRIPESLVDREHKLEKGLFAIYCTNYNEDLNWHLSKKNENTLLHLRMSKSYFESFTNETENLKKMMDLSKSFYLLEDLNPMMKIIFDRIFSLDRHQLFYPNRIKNLIEALLYNFFTNITNRKEVKDNNKYSYNYEPVFKAKQLLNENLNRIVSIDELTKSVGLSESRLRVLFKEIFGTTLNVYHQDIRLLKAKEDLLNNEKSVSMIAMDYGFSSSSHFSTAFKKKFGYSPRDFIQQQEGKSA